MFLKITPVFDMPLFWFSANGRKTDVSWTVNSDSDSDSGLLTVDIGILFYFVFI